MGNNLKSIGILVGVVTFFCGVVIATLMVVHPALLMQPEEWTLINLLDNDNGLWMDEDGNLKINSAEGYEIGETYESEVKSDFGMVLLGLVFIIFGWCFLVGHSRIESK